MTVRPTAGRAVTILAAIADHGSCTVLELQRWTGYSRSSVYRHLAELQRAELVHPGGRSDEYCAGAAALRLADSYRRHSLFSGLVAARLRLLAESTGELSAFLVRNGSEALCVESVEGTHILRCSYAVGRAQPLRAGASALAILAHLPAAQLPAILTAVGVADADADRLHQRLAAIRRQGAAISDGEVDEGVWGVSAPVTGADGGLLGVVTLMAPTTRGHRRADEFTALVRAAARELTGQAATPRKDT